MRRMQITSTPKTAKAPKRNDERVILHFIKQAIIYHQGFQNNGWSLNYRQDYDCFYASVFENEEPSLKTQPLGIKQKSILATCNYVARARGVKKLMLISEAQRICPDLVLRNGEDLTRFRDASKRLCSFLRAHSWNGRVERLGLDEVFLDITDLVAYNRDLLNLHNPRDSFFHLSRQDPERGFAFDGSWFFGCVHPPSHPSAVDGGGKHNHHGRPERGGSSISNLLHENPACMNLMLASHLAGYLRHKIDEDFGYTSSVGISTNKVLAKLAGAVNKPHNQTALLEGSQDCFDDIQEFMDAHHIRKLPGLGSRTAQLIRNYILPSSVDGDGAGKQELLGHDQEEGEVTVRQVRQYPGMGPEILERILVRPGSERGAGEKIWNLLHAVDNTEVKNASVLPTQISIEDTYMSRPLQTMAELTRELHALAASLIKRMRVDLAEIGAHPAKARSGSESEPQLQTQTSNGIVDSPAPAHRWLAYPKTLRLSTRAKPRSSSTSNNDHSHPFSRNSRSLPLPSWIFNLQCDLETLASRLVAECLLPLFRRLHPGQNSGGWNLALINICVTNMVMVATAADSEDGAELRDGFGSKGGSNNNNVGSRDISRMFRTQETKLREWTVYDTSDPVSTPTPRPVEGSPLVTSSNGQRPESERDQGSGPLPASAGQTQERPGPVSVPPVMSQDHNNNNNIGGGLAAWDNDDDDDLDVGDYSQNCPLCGHAIPEFAVSAHERFHALGH